MPNCAQPAPHPVSTVNSARAIPHRQSAPHASSTHPSSITKISVSKLLNVPTRHIPIQILQRHQENAEIVSTIVGNAKMMEPPVSIVNRISIFINKNASRHRNARVAQSELSISQIIWVIAKDVTLHVKHAPRLHKHASLVSLHIT